MIIFGAGASRGGLHKSEVPPPIDIDFFDTANQLVGHGTPKESSVIGVLSATIAAQLLLQVRYVGVTLLARLKAPIAVTA